MNAADVAVDAADIARVALARRDRRQFVALYEAYADRVFRYARARTGSATVADDIVEETMLEVLAGLDRFDSERGTVAGWVFAIARQHAGRWERRQGYPQRIKAKAGFRPAILADDALDDANHPEISRRVRSLLASLSPAEREVVLLRYSAALTTRDIAAALAVSHDVARTRLDRTIERMTRRPNASYQTPGDLDNLLERMLGSGTLSSEQRARHLDDMGLGPASTQRHQHPAPAIPGHVELRETITYGGPRLRLRWVGVAGIVVACAVTGWLVMASLIDRRAVDSHRPLPEQPAAVASPTLMLAPTAPGASTSRERVYVVGHVFNASVATADAFLTTGRITALDALTGTYLWSLYLRARVDAMLSHDGAILYVVTHGDRQGLGNDELLAVDTATGDVVWRTQTPDRAWWPRGYGSSSLSLSADGETLFVSSCAVTGFATCAPGDTRSLQVFATSSGERLRVHDIPPDACLGTSYIAPDMDTLYLVCDEGNSVALIGVTTGALVHLPVSGEIIGSDISPDGRRVYVVAHASGNYHLAEIDLTTGTVTRERSIATVGEQPDRALDLVGRSPDGSHLFVGILTAPETGPPSAQQIVALDTNALAEQGRTLSPLPITAQSLAVTDDNHAAFAAHNIVERDVGGWARSTVLRLSVDSAAQTLVVLEHQEVSRLLYGR